MQQGLTYRALSQTGQEYSHTVTDTQMMVRTEVTIDGRSFFLAQGHEPDDLQKQIEAALETPGRFVTFTVVGNRQARVLITPRSKVVFTVETVPYDERDTGDNEFPFGGFYDY